MRLQVSLIPALAFALSNFLFNLAGAEREAAAPTQKALVVALQISQQHSDNQRSFDQTAMNRCFHWSNETGSATEAWKIPYLLTDARLSPTPFLPTR